ncbi:type III secretion system protein PrgD, partial [Enterococcus faecalis]
SGEESDKATQKQVKKNVSEGVLKEIKGSKEQIRTLFLWESKKEGNQWLLTYDVTLKVAKEETEIRQMKVAMVK